MHNNTRRLVSIIPVIAIPKMSAYTFLAFNGYFSRKLKQKQHKIIG